MPDNCDGVSVRTGNVSNIVSLIEEERMTMNYFGVVIKRK